MLEEAIKELTVSINILNKTLLHFEDLAEAKNNPDKVEEQPEETQVEEKADSKDNTESVNREELDNELKQLCLKIVRANSKNRKKIKLLISKAGGELITDVPEENLSDLKTSLKGLL